MTNVSKLFYPHFRKENYTFFWYYVFNYSENSYHLCIEPAYHLHTENYIQQKMHLCFYSHVHIDMPTGVPKLSPGTGNCFLKHVNISSIFLSPTLIPKATNSELTEYSLQRSHIAYHKAVFRALGHSFWSKTF